MSQGLGTRTETAALRLAELGVAEQVVSRVHEVGDIRMHCVSAGSGPLMLLLHGWPQTWFMWRNLLAPLSADHHVVAVDLRGYGLTDKPTTGYDKRTMAADVRELVAQLGHDRAIVVGHDRGARVGHRLALDHPDVVERFVALDILPTRAVMRNVDSDLAPFFWHWYFHMQPGLPEMLVGSQVRAYLEFFFERWAFHRSALEPAAVDEYVSAFAAPGALSAGFEDYRATRLDVAHDDEDVAAGNTVRAPVLALWGAAGLLERAGSVLEVWEEYADNVQGTAIAECGHFLAEERPEEVLAHVRTFLTDGSS